MGCGSHGAEVNPPSWKEITMEDPNEIARACPVSVSAIPLPPIAAIPDEEGELAPLPFWRRLLDDYARIFEYWESKGTVFGDAETVRFLVNSLAVRLTAEIIELTTCDYKLYLRTHHWSKVRDRTLRTFHDRCAVCNSGDQIDVHHRTYERRGYEAPADTIALCRRCHVLFHKNGRLARKEDDQ